MARTVDGADGRRWVLRNTVSWTPPAGESAFEHDLASGRRSGTVLVAMLVLLVIVLMTWRPSSVAVPTWLLVLILIAALFLPARWLCNRPWTLVAETSGDMTGGDYVQQPAERWVGTTRGVRKAWQDFREVRRAIHVNSTPDEHGPLRLVE
jgi:hypothetical protein